METCFLVVFMTLKEQRIIGNDVNGVANVAVSSVAAILAAPFVAVNGGNDAIFVALIPPLTSKQTLEFVERV